jgi:S-DNA-T family DNA segregation ATPase FtsK/SpoIIIE
MHRHEICGVVTGAAFLLLTLSLLSFQREGGNWVGAIGEFLAGHLVAAFGFGAYLLPVELLLGTLFLFGRRHPAQVALRASSMLVVMFAVCAMLHLGLRGSSVAEKVLPGGAVGEVLGEVMRSLIGPVGSFVVLLTLLLVTLLQRTSLSIVELSGRVMALIIAGTRYAARAGLAMWQAWREAKAIERQEREREALEAEPRIVPGTSAAALESWQQEEEDESDAVESEPSADDGEDGEQDEAGAPDDDQPAAAIARSLRRPRGRSRSEPVIVAPSGDQLTRRGNGKRPVASGAGAGGVPFVLPPPTLLANTGDSSISIDAATLKENAARLVEKLAAYGVNGRVDEIHPGPVVTMYEFEPASGTKISKIASLSDDLALALAAEKVRIVAPIPGKARVGFELPNRVRKTVFLRELLEDDRWQQIDYALPVALGKDIAGRPVYQDLSRMPHLLVAGATGSGKSVGLSVMLVSLLCKKTPEQVRLLMIDPKVVELEVFDGIPHMLLPVVTDMKKAALALRWAVDEMERRYQLFADAGVRNIASYNERVQKVLRGELDASSLLRNKIEKARLLRSFAPGLSPENEGGDGRDAEEREAEKLPHVVLVVDEYSDLMIQAAKEVESAIARLAQKARAAGIHVILATQRPSVDVITGMIKANFPCRMAYKVSQREDSKTILGRSGAENLLGNGDMLALMPGSSDLKRVHSAFIDQESEVRKVCEFLRAQGNPVYDEQIIRPRDDDEAVAFGERDPAEDSLYDQAVAIVAQAGYCSISHLQRNLSIGYNKAAKLVERMEKQGVVGPQSGKAGGRREVLIQPR